ncbi:MAG: aminotransferase class I/II-fold pyridoxal phosphate-dependent enzyme, partial [Methanobacteriota archaeon]
MNKRIYLSPPHMSGYEMQYIKEAFEQNWIAPLGPNVDGFEKEMTIYLAEEDIYAVALSSGTAAIHLSLILAGVQKDDVVICQSFTFAATANPIIYQGAIPVFIDSETDTWNMDPNLLEDAIKELKRKNKKPKAVVAVDLYGMPARLNEIREVCSKYDLILIEDAAEALGSSYFGKKAGTFGDFGILSFNGNKIITTSGGGMLITHKKEIADKARYLATQAREPFPHYEHVTIGYNYRMSNILAGIGRGQLKVIDQRVTRRREIFNQYQSLLRNIEAIEFPAEPDGFISNRWLTTMIIKPGSSQVTPETIRLELEKYNIESRPLWKPMHLQPVYKNCDSWITGISEQLFR